MGRLAVLTREPVTHQHASLSDGATSGLETDPMTGLILDRDARCATPHKTPPHVHARPR